MSFEKRLDQLITESGLSYKEIASKTSIKAGNISHYRLGKVKPSFNAIIDLANLFNVTTDYLLLGKENDVVPTSNINISSQNNLSTEEYYWIDLYRQTPENTRQYLLSMVKSFLQAIPIESTPSSKNLSTSTNTDEHAATTDQNNSNIA